MLYHSCKKQTSKRCGYYIVPLLCLSFCYYTVLYYLHYPGDGSKIQICGLGTTKGLMTGGSKIFNSVLENIYVSTFLPPLNYAFYMILFKNKTYINVRYNK